LLQMMLMLDYYNKNITMKLQHLLRDMDLQVQNFYNNHVI